jgi:predicted ATPase/DNA-binding SARP family transcriptional activator
MHRTTFHAAPFTDHLSMNTFRLYLFGLPHLERDGVVVKLARRKALALLSYLAATGKPQARDSLATLFWPDYGQSAARSALSRHLYDLNKLLGENALMLETESVALGDDLWLDVAEFERVLATYPTVTAHNLSTVQAAIALYTADFLTGFTLPDCPDFDEWQSFHSESLRQTLRTVLAKVALTQAVAPDFESAITIARRWLALDTLDEAAHRALMQFYAQAGQQSAALRQYEQCRQLLQDELGAPPDAETTALVERIRQGEFRQSDKVTGRQEAFRQAQEAGDHSPFTIDNLHNLPAQTTPFIGRARELTELTQRLIDPATRLVTIIGPGGMGKTRLARQAGRRLLDQVAAHFPDGVWFLSLAAVDATTFGPALNPLVNGLADLFGLRLHGGAAPQEQVLAYLQGRRLLLILDNLEHLLDESEVISQLLSGAPALTVLATSRERLNLQEEWLFPLAGLALTLPPSNSPQKEEDRAFPPLGGTAGGLTEAVQLFQQSAQRLQPAFDLPPHLNAVGQICRLVEGLPLGIELAASWVRYMAPAEIVQEIEKDIDFLATNVRNLPARHRSLRAVFDHSWRLLSPQEQAALPQLAIFRGGFRLAEAQAVTGASRPVLTALVDKSLISVSAEGRYDLHERLRQYLLEKLREELTVYQTANERHSQVYLALLQLERAEFNNQTTLQRLTADFDNIRAAWHWALDHHDWSAIRRSRWGLHFFCLHKGWYLEENEFYERTISRLQEQLAQLGATPKIGPETGIETGPEMEIQLLLIALHCHRSEMQTVIGAHDPARQTMLAEHINTLRTFGPIAYPELVDVLSGATVPHLKRLVEGHVAQRRYSQELLSLAQASGDSYAQWRAIQGVGFAALFAGQFEEAAGYADHILAVAEVEGNWIYQHTGLSIRSHIALARGDYPQAEAYKRQGYEPMVHIDPNYPAIPFFLADLANIARLQGDYAQARNYLQQAKMADQRLGRGQPAALRHFRRYAVLLVVGYLAETEGDLGAATAAFAEIWQQDQNQSHYSAAALIGLGWVALQGEDWSAARQHFAAAFPLIEKLETAPQALEALAGIAHLQRQAGQLEQALALIGLIQRHPSSYQESKDRLVALETALRLKLSPAQVQAALAQGRESELWTTVAAVRG